MSVVIGAFNIYLLITYHVLVFFHGINFVSIFFYNFFAYIRLAISGFWTYLKTTNCLEAESVPWTKDLSHVVCAVLVVRQKV